MKLDDIRKTMKDDPKALLATCEWSMVRPVEPVSDKWVPTSDSQGKTTFEILAETDPWAKCGTAKRPRVRGVLVESFEYDAEGKQKESQGKMLVRARDIGGTWGEFLSLHAEEVKVRGEKYEATKERAELQKKLTARVKALGLTWPIGTVEGRETGDRGFYSMGLSSEVSAGASEHYNYDSQVKRYKEIRPAGFQLSRNDIKLRVSAGNPADVEYLFEVLEEGVKAVERKRARRSKKEEKNA